MTRLCHTQRKKVTNHLTIYLKALNSFSNNFHRLKSRWVQHERFRCLCSSLHCSLSVDHVRVWQVLRIFEWGQRLRSNGMWGRVCGAFTALVGLVLFWLAGERLPFFAANMLLILSPFHSSAHLIFCKMAETRKPNKLYNIHPKEYGKGGRACRVTGRPGGMGLIRKYGINMKRQVFRERAIDMGWEKYS